MNFDIDTRQILPAFFFFITVMPMTAMALFGFSSFEATQENKTIQTLVEIWIVLIIPITLYIMFFSKFHNPFKEKIQ